MSKFDRRDFIKHVGAGIAGLELASMGPMGYGPVPFSKYTTKEFSPMRPRKDAVSLATWSLHRSYSAGIWNLLDIARICREAFDIGGVEYVTTFFTDVRQIRLKELNQRADDYGVDNVLIMVDLEGDLVSPDEKERQQAVINHRKWVDIAAYLGCFAIRCNATGGGPSPEADPDALDRAAESFSALLDYSEKAGIDILVENHGGGLASNAEWLVDLAREVDNPNFGLLPDYGNFRVEDPEMRYEYVGLTMPYALDVSVKGRWSPQGEHMDYDLEKCLRISKASGYSGYWGIESSMRQPDNTENSLSPLQIMNQEWQAVAWTKAAIDRIVFS